MDLRWPASRAEIAAIQRERKRIAFERARKAPFYKGRLDGIDAEPPGRPGHLGEDPAADQGRPSQDRAQGFSRTVLHPAAGRGGRILAIGRVHRAALVLSALGRGHRAFAAVLPTRSGSDRRDLRRSRAHFLSARHPSRGASLCACRGAMRHRDRLVRRRHEHRFGHAAAAHRRASAHHLDRHGELRPAPGRSRRDREDSIWPGAR